jgi:hypothetical protein
VDEVADTRAAVPKRERSFMAAMLLVVVVLWEEQAAGRIP